MFTDNKTTIGTLITIVYTEHGKELVGKIVSKIVANCMSGTTNDLNVSFAKYIDEIGLNWFKVTHFFYNVLCLHCHFVKLKNNVTCGKVFK